MDRNPRFKNLNISSFGLFFGALVLTLYIFTPSASAGTIIKSPAYLGLQRGLVGCWSFDGSYTKVPDCSGNNNTGTLTNGPTRTQGKVGQALEFGANGSINAYVNIGAPAILNNVSPMTLSVWVKGEGYGGSSQGAILTKENGSDTGWRLQYIVTNDRLLFQVDYIGTDLLVETSGLSSTFNQWTHWLVTWDGSTSASNVHIYKNGVEVSYVTQQNATDSRINDSTRSLFIGNSTLSGREFDGLIDDARIYNRVLSVNEISRLYRIGLGSTANRSLTNSPFDKGLVGHWTFDGPDISGTRAKDRSRNANHGTITGAIAKQGKIGQALSFDGVNDIINAGSAASLDEIQNQGGGGMTVSFWIKPPNTNNFQYIISKSNAANGGGGWGINKNGSGNQYRLLFEKEGTPDSQASYNSVLAPDVWQHIVFTWNGSMTFSTGVKIYKNAIEITTGTAFIDGAAANSDASRILCIGGYSSDDITCNQNFTDDILDDVRIYNRVLSVNEINRLYQTTQSKFNASKTDSLTHGLVGYWTFDGPDIGLSGTRAKDRSGNNNHGTLTNGPVRKAGKIGQALSFDGGDDEVLISHNAVFNIGTKYTEAVWIKPNELNRAQLILRKWPGEDKSLFMYSTNAPACNLSGWSPAGDLVGNTTLKTGMWYHIVCVYDGTTATFYINGVADVSAARSGDITDDTNSMYIGFDPEISTRHFNGLIDDVRIYNRALSASEVNKLYQMGR